MKLLIPVMLCLLLILFAGKISEIPEMSEIPAERQIPVMQTETVALETCIRNWAETVSGLTAPEQALLAHEFLTAHCTYDASAPDRHLAAGALLHGRAVCDGYAAGYLCCMTACGIPCKVVSGTAEEIPHAWNLIQLDGEWYHVDCTWDDSAEGSSRFEWFLCDDGKMQQTHQWDRTQYPAASGHAYSYSILIGCLLDKANSTSFDKISQNPCG